MDRFHLMQTFVAVVDCEGLSGAARRLKLSPPAVTRALAELERRLGVQLLTRTTRFVRVTDAGARYAEDCRRILAEVEEADALASGAQAHASGHLVVTAPVLFGRMCVAPVVTAYLRAHPQVTAACWFVDRVVNLVDEGVDVAVRIGELPDSSLIAQRVGQVRQVVCAAPAYLDAHAAPRRPQDLREHVVISADAVTATREWRFADAHGRAVRIEPRVTTTSNDAAIAMALDGFGITRLLSYQAAPHLATGALQAVLEDFEPAPMPVHVLHREGRRASKKVRSFLELAVSMLSSHPAIA